MKLYYETEYGRLYHGDAYDFLTAGRVPERYALLTDPMYGIGANTKTASTQRGKDPDYLKDWNIREDDTPFDPAPWLRFNQVILWGGNHYPLPPASKWIVWDKRCKNTNRDDNADCEMAWTNLPGVSRVYHQLWKGYCRAGEENLSVQGAKLHPFQKPVALMSYCVQQFRLDSGSVVVDPFAGSGSTAVACERLGVRWIAIEIEKHFCEITTERLKTEARQPKLFVA